MTNETLDKRQIYKTDDYSLTIYDETVFYDKDHKKTLPLLHCTFSTAKANIPSNIFSHLTKSPDIVYIPLNVDNASPNVFDSCNFKYLYQLENSEYRILSKYKINFPNIKAFAPISDLGKVLYGLTNEKLVNITDYNEMIIFAKKIASTKTFLPFDFYCKLKDEDMVKIFMENAYFKHFNKELSPYFNQIKNLPPKEQTAFYAFANALGCFSKENIVDENYEKTDSLLCYKASNLLARLLRSGTLKFGTFYDLFKQLPLDIDPNQQFYHFLSAQNGKNNFVNASLLVQRSKYNKDYFCKIMQNFDKAQKFKVILDENGQPEELSWGNALTLFYHSSGYKNVTKDNKSLAKIYSNYGINQKTFNNACDIFAEAKIAGTPHHILGKPLKEYNDGSKMFTYEFLDKHNPKNAILGLFCSCCANISSRFYGQDIAIASIQAPDVQNVVIRDKKGTIIAKGTLYVNFKKSYAVFNDFEISYKYRSFDSPNEDYNNLKSINQIKRKEIFNTFLRAIRDFKNEYDKQYPEKPLKRVSVGRGYNKLNDLCEENLEQANTLLRVPKDYNFRDTSDFQYLLIGQNRQRKNKENKTLEK